MFLGNLIYYCGVSTDLLRSPQMQQQQNINETDLLVKIAQRDQAALSLLYDRYAKVMYSVAFKMLGTVEEAEEAVLDVFQQVWRTAERYDAKKAKVDTWLFMQIRSRSLDKLRARQRLSRTTQVPLETMDVELHAQTPSPIEDAVVIERRALVIAAIKKLPPEQQQVIELIYFKGLTHSEIAAQTGIALGTIKTRIRLGLNKLRQALANLEN